LNKHFGTKFHQLAAQRAKYFCDVMMNRTISTDLQANTRIAKRVTENWLKLRSIAATVFFFVDAKQLNCWVIGMTGLPLTVMLMTATVGIFMLNCSFV